MIGEEEKTAPVGKGKKKKKGGASGMSGAAALFKKKLELKLGAGEGNGDIEASKEKSKQAEVLKGNELTSTEVPLKIPFAEELVIQENKADRVVEQIQSEEIKVEIT